MMMIRGKGVSEGVAMGTLSFYRRAAVDIKPHSVENPDAERRRFRDAQAAAAAQLDELAAKARTEAGEEAARLLETHRMMAQDPDYEESVERFIRDEHFSAEHAVLRTGEQFAQMFAEMDDGYMQLRGADIRDVSDRIIAILCGAAQRGTVPDQPVLLAADDIAPSELIRMDRSRILGFITAKGDRVSHTAILARAMGIPAIVGVGDNLRAEYEGRTVIADGSTGEAFIDPDEETCERMMKKRTQQLECRHKLGALRGQENRTKDGQTIRISCSITSPEDVPAVLDSDGDGVGLFRSEFLYLNAEACPTEDEQFEAYRAVLAAMEGRRVVIRTCDLGADKQIDDLELPREENPAMGMRGLRISLSRPDLLRKQLRALYRAGVCGRLGVMLPMVTSVWEVREVKRLIGRVKAELRAEGIPYSEHVELGVMIETPAAALMSDQLAREADFFSCGTNDLAQYTLACDRQSGSLDRFYDPYHPAVLRLIRMTVDNAHKRGVRAGVCGELGADPAMLETFLAIGADELSVSPHAVLPLRNAIRSTDMSGKRARILAALESGEQLPLR